MVEVKKKALILALLFSSAFFLAGLSLGRTFAELSMRDLLSSINKLRNSMLSIEVGFELAKNGGCSEEMLSRIGVEVSKIGKNLELLERERGFKDETVLELKEYYNLLLIRYYLLAKKMKNACGFNYSLVLFFYTNDEKYRDVCLEQGKYLDYVVYRLTPKKVKVFAIESRLINNTIIYEFVESFNVTRFPTLVIDGKKYEGLLYPKQLLALIGG